MSFLSNLFGQKSNSSEKITILDPEAYAEAIDMGQVQLVDVRTASEYRSGHIKNAKNIDWFKQKNFTESVKKLDKDQEVYLYCRSGARSLKAGRKLLDMGFTKVYDLKGGFNAWKR
ncbi:rhodanese-like domain-containing protein [Zeaxanthinibacter sp. PT1]|uniref:rhodanese-like domain-containing protein n=1 Tax=Zeaxanthinibacter TaxID=561554 RepID=UPI00234AC92D|nr:rhodanese-like domain-containing protein [Zeaxanthinibacter sp. PT1]MDC6351372.1 rhodanese-like domain-containing protein [Zeaxanthinibacter sp. PT1]